MTASDWCDFDAFLDHIQREHGSEQRDHPWGADVRCPVCNRNHFVRDDVHGESICCGCGWVDESDVFPEIPHSHVRYRNSAPYSQVYHFNEVMAAWLCVGPRIPDADMDAIRHYLASTPIATVTPTSFTVARGFVTKKRLQPKQLERQHIRHICHNVGLKKYAERWVQIKRRLDPTWVVVYPSNEQLYNLRRDFALVARAFNRTLYRQGKRRTVRDNLWSSGHSLARHNMPHYSWLIQNLLNRIGGQALLEKVSADKFFPIQRTASVRRRLRRMWAIICTDLGWPIQLL